MEEPLVNGNYLLQKYPGKGGWTYAEIPEIIQNKNNPFGWVTVKGSIDDFKIKQHKLMPMGKGKLFLPVKAAIRKQLNKAAGDVVHLVLFFDESIVEIPDEILECFKLESKEQFETFQSFTEGERKSYLDWIYSAKTEETKANRIAQMMNRLSRKLRISDEMH